MTGEHETEAPSDQVTEVDIDITPIEEGGRSSWLLRAVAAVGLVAVLIAGALWATGDDDDVEVAADDTTQTEEPEPASDDDSTEGDDGDSTDATNDRDAEDESDDDYEVSEEGADAAFEYDTAAADYAYGYGESSILFDGEKFVGIGYGPEGPTVRQSVDGIEWDEKPVSGLPENVNIYRLAEHDGTYVAIVESWDESGEDSEFFGPVGGPSTSLASSTDLKNWTLVPLETEEGKYTNISGLAFGDAGVVMLAQSHLEGPDEMRLLFEAGILSEDNLESYCGFEVEDDAVVVYSCEYDDEPAFDEESYEDAFGDLEERWEAATSDEERAEIEAELEALHFDPNREELVRFGPGDEIYEVLSNLYTDRGEGPEFPETFAFVGPPTGPFEKAALAADGYVDSVATTGSAFVTVMADYRSDGPNAQVLVSSDGLDWSPGGALPSGVNGQVIAVGDALMFTGGSELGQPVALVSNDDGASWTSVDIPSSLYQAYPQLISGPAGVVAVLQGSLEPFEYPQEPTGEISVSRDGYTLTIDMRDNGKMTLTGPDGAVIHTLSEEDMWGEGNADGVVRTNPFTGTPTFLDPDTGEDLVSFTDEDFEAAWGSVEDDWVEPEYGMEILFSADGTTWTVIEDERLSFDENEGSVNPVAVGDDEIIFAKHTWNEPPAELFAFEEEGREPTGAEIEALEGWESQFAGDNAVEYIRVEV